MGNKYTLKKLVCSSALIIISFVCFFLAGVEMKNAKLFMGIMLVCEILILLIWLISDIMYSRQIEKMTNEIDSILLGKENVSLSDYSEGNLCILRNQISKITHKLMFQAEQLEKEKTHLADSLADVSHQIRTPLTSLNLLVEALRKEENNKRNIETHEEWEDEKTEPEETHEEWRAGETRREKLFEMDRQLKRIDTLVVSLLKIAKIDAGTIKLCENKVELDKMVNMALTPLEIMLDIKNIMVKKDISGSYTGDIVWSSEAVGNIVKNCMEHTCDEGVISIRGSENGIYTELVIEDSGSGIDEEDIKHIFERFYGGKRNNKESYGIGLALAKMIIVQQNGTIKAENVLDVNTKEKLGARFTIRFYKSVV